MIFKKIFKQLLILYKLLYKYVFNDKLFFLFLIVLNNALIKSLIISKLQSFYFYKNV